MLNLLMFLIIALVAIVVGSYAVIGLYRRFGSDVKCKSVGDHHDHTDTEEMEAIPIKSDTTEIDLNPVSDDEHSEPQTHQTHKVDQRQISTSIIVKEKERFISDDEIRFHAYMLASEDNFKKDPKEYWVQAEKELRA